MRMHSCISAAAKIRGGEEVPGLSGTVKFTPTRNGTLVRANIRGLPQGGDGIFAFHIHKGTDCGGLRFANTGTHFDPTVQPHPEHAGDLLPLLRCYGGSAFLSFITDRFQIPDIIGRTVVIHSGSDDFHSQPAGNSGAKIACGIILPSV